MVKNIKKEIFKLKNGRELIGWKVYFKDNKGILHSWNTMDYKEALKFNKTMNTLKKKKNG